jgi:hypothetical protein
MRQFYRSELLTRKIDTQGYVTSNQHRGHAHDDGWPFPTWAQSGGAGWLFSHVGDPYVKMFSLPLLTSLAGWGTNEIRAVTHNPQTGLQLDLGPQASLSSPPINVDTLVSPFIAIEWTGNLGDGAKPFLEWTTADAPEFTSSRRVAFSATPMGKPGRNITMIETRGHPLWKGRITRLRVHFGNPASAQITFRGLHTAVDSRHPINNSQWLVACADYFDWTTDVEFLRVNLGRMRQAADYAIREFGLEEHGVAVVPWVGHDGRPGFAVSPDGKKSIFPGRGVGNNYWDLLPFGAEDAMLTTSLQYALRRIGELEDRISREPDWKLPSAPGRGKQLRSLATRLQHEGAKRFWDSREGRFAGWVDRDGVAHDYGFTFLNLEAVYYGLATPDQARTIVDWVSGKRVVEGDTSQGADIYHWRFGPRATTRRNVDCYGWVWHNPETIPWGYQVQDGGAVLGFSFYDLMARLQVNGPDDAWQRLRPITEWFAEVQEAGGYRKYYAVPGRGSLQGGGPPGGLGMDHEFMESVLLPQVMIYGFLGLKPEPGGFQIDPRLPKDWPSLTITRVAVQDYVLDLTAAPGRIEIKCRASSGQPLSVLLPRGTWRLVRRDKASSHRVRSDSDRVQLKLEPGHTAVFTRR